MRIGDTIVYLKDRIMKYSAVLSILEEIYGGTQTPQQPVIQVREDRAATLGMKRSGNDGSNGGRSDKAEVILDYLARNPGSKSPEIAKALKYSKSAVGFHLTRLKKMNRVSLDNRCWSLVSETAGPKPDFPEASGNINSAKPHTCPKCGKGYKTHFVFMEHVKNCKGVSA